MGNKLSGVQIGIIAAALVTALIHLGLSVVLLGDPIYQTLGILFIFNGLGYMALLAAYFLPQPIFRKRHALIRWALMGFAAVTIVAWAIVNGDFNDPLGVAAKLAELTLIILLFLDRSKG